MQHRKDQETGEDKDSFDEEMRAGLSTVREESTGFSLTSPRPQSKGVSSDSLGKVQGRSRPRAIDATSTGDVASVATGEVQGQNRSRRRSRRRSSVQSDDAGAGLVADNMDEGLQMGIPANVRREVSRRRASIASSEAASREVHDPDQEEDTTTEGGLTTTALPAPATGSYEGEASRDIHSEGDSPSGDVVYTVVPMSAASDEGKTDGHS